MPEYLDALARQYGYFRNEVLNLVMTVIEGKSNMVRMLDALRKERGHDPGENVSRAGRRQPWVAEVADEDSPARRRDQCVRALEEDDRAHVVGTGLDRVHGRRQLLAAATAVAARLTAIAPATSSAGWKSATRVNGSLRVP